jgi:hypothetical protein
MVESQGSKRRVTIPQVKVKTPKVKSKVPLINRKRKEWVKMARKISVVC